MFHAIVTDYLKKIEIGYLWSKRKSNTVTEIFFIHKPHVTQLSPLWGSIHSVSIVLPLCLAETHHRHTGTSWKKKKAEFNFAPLRRTILYSWNTFHIPASVWSRISEIGDDLGTVESRDFCRCSAVISLAAMTGIYCSTGSLPSSFQKFGHIVLSSCGLVRSLLPQGGLLAASCRNTRGKTEHNSSSLSLSSLRSCCCHGQWGVWLRLDKFCLPSFLPPLFKKQQLDSTAANAH